MVINEGRQSDFIVHFASFICQKFKMFRVLKVLCSLGARSRNESLRHGAKVNGDNHTLYWEAHNTRERCERNTLHTTQMQAFSLTHSKRQGCMRCI